VIQNLRPDNESIRELEIEIGPDGHVARDDRAVAAAKPPPAPAASSLSAKPPSLAAAPPAASPGAPAAGSAKAAAPAAVQVAAPAPAPALWKRKAGPWLTGIGVALVAGGAAVGMMNRDLASDLDAKRATGSLTAEDRSSYDQVQTYNTLSTALFAAGGVAVASGAWIWITAPAAPGQPAAVGAGGRF
jgi:2-oxoglutarate dehydrogenase E2 component (dihydrolipoamide succinyltransferase)